MYLLIIIAGFAAISLAGCAQHATAANSAPTPQAGSVMSYPPDTSSHRRPAIPQDLAPGGKPAIAPGVNAPQVPTPTASPG